MTQSKAHQRATNKYNSKAYWRPVVFFKVDEKETILKYSNTYPSFNAFVHDAVMEKIERMNIDNSEDM